MYKYLLIYLCLFVLMCMPGYGQQTVWNEEVRGVWITNVDSEVLFSKANIADAMDFLAERGFNVVFPVVWNKGYTLYPSAVMDSLFGISQDPFFAQQGRDPLAELIIEAHRNGMEVMPWFEYGFATSYSQNGGHILEEKPEWAAIDKDGNLVVRNGFDWMNPLHPEVEAFMLGLFQEVIEQYDVDGVQGDDRLPAMPVEGGYSTYTRALYAEENNGNSPPDFKTDPRWVQWRSDKLTSFGGRLYRMVKEQNTDLTVSMSPSVWPWSRENYLQDWPAWLDSNYVDIVHPQVYRWDLSSFQNEIRRLFGTVSGTSVGYVDRDQRPLVAPGLIAKAGGRFNPPSMMIDMVSFNRQFQGSGEVYFFYEGMGPQNEFLADTLYATFYEEPAIMPGRKQLWRPMPLIVLPTDNDVQLEGAWEADDEATGFNESPLVGLPGTGVSATITVQAPYSAAFDIYAYIPPFRQSAASNVVYTIRAGERVQEIMINQSLPSTTGWMKLETLMLEEGLSVVVTIRSAASTEEPVYLDAFMLLLNRALSPGLIVDVALTSTDIFDERKQPEVAANYPNPFQQQTSIPFTLHSEERVQLRVFDILGRQVHVVYEEDILPPGRHVITFDGSTLAPGIYMYELEAGVSSFKNKMIIIR